MPMDRDNRGPRGRKRRKVCAFCVDKVECIDYKDAAKLRRYISEGDLGHQLPGDDLQHPLQLGHVLRGKAGPDTAHDSVEIMIADVVIIQILLGRHQVVLPLILLGLPLFYIPLLDQAVDLVGRVGGRDAHEIRKLVHRGLPQGQDDLHAEGLHCGQRGLPPLETPEHRPVKMQLEFGVHLVKILLQQDGPLLFSPVFSAGVHFIRDRPAVQQRRSILPGPPACRSPGPPPCRSPRCPPGGSAHSAAPARLRAPPGA